MSNDLQRMLAALRDSQQVPTKLEAGLVLAAGGWAVFPAPNNQKFAQGLSYLNATIDPGRFSEMAQYVMGRFECTDVNVCLCPGKSVVPLIVIDLDGADAMWRFHADAEKNLQAPMLKNWLRVNTTRVDTGRHMYFVAPEGRQWGNSVHVWGGDVRSGRGHVVLPPSTTENGRYTWSGELLLTAPEWVLAGLRGSPVKNLTKSDEKSDDEIAEDLEELSQWNHDAYGQKALNGLVFELLQAQAGAQQGGRNPMLSKTINRVLDLALENHVNALQAVNQVCEAYESMFAPDEGRNPVAEVVRCVQSWFRNKESIDKDVEVAADLMAWATQRGGGAAQDVELPENVMKDERASGTARSRRRTRKSWKDSTNK